MAQVVNGVTEINLEVAGIQPQLDDTDKLATSLYGKGTVAGDVAIDVDADGHIQIDELTHSALTSADVVTVTGGASQVADVKVTLDSETIVLATSAAIIGSVNPYTLEPNGAQADQRLTVDDTVGGVQFSAFHADTTHIFWTSEAAECRVTFDGSAPTTANGHVIPPDSSGIWTKALAAAAKFIRTGATSAVIHASQMDGV